MASDFEQFTTGVLQRLDDLRSFKQFENNAYHPQLTCDQNLAQKAVNNASFDQQPQQRSSKRPQHLSFFTTPRPDVPTSEPPNDPNFKPKGP